MTDLTNRESTLFDLAKQYRASQVRSANENDIRGDIRETVEKLGLDSKSFQDSIRMELELTEGDRLDYVNGLQEMSGILKDRTVDLFGEEEARKKAERIKRREDKAAKAAGTAPADSPRGDPAKGGAGGVDGKKAAKDAKPKAVEPAVTKRKPGRPKKGGDNVVPINGNGKADDLKVGELVQAQDKPAADDVQAQEQADGAALLDGALAATKDGAAADLAALPDVSGDGSGIDTADMLEVEEDGDAMIRRVSAQKNAELEARGGMNGMAPIDASGDGEPVENSGDGKPLSQSAQAAAKREAAARLN